MESTSENTAFQLSDSAVRRIAVLAQKEAKEGVHLRITVDGGGCSGFQYKFGFDTAINDDDVLIHKNGVDVVIDSVSLGFVNGAMLDYVETLGAAHFEIKNPNATATCGCGNSFSV